MERAVKRGGRLVLLVYRNVMANCSVKMSPHVGVGMTVARNPLHGSQRAELPHWALALGNNAKSP